MGFQCRYLFWVNRILRALRYLGDPFGRAKLAHFLRSLIFRKGRDEEVLSVKDLDGFWEDAHAERKSLWLTGSHPKEVIDRLDILIEIADNPHPILDVGVGLGFMVQFLSERGKSVSALDISRTGLDRVRNLVTATYRDSSDLPDETFGLIMHHLVAQHMSDKDLLPQMRHLIRSLSENRLVAMQFASPPKGGSSAAVQTIERQAGGGVTRSPDEMRELVLEAGGEVLEVLPREVFPNTQYWVVKFKKST